jgi:molybdate transport system permease protein
MTRGTAATALLGLTVALSVALCAIPIVALIAQAPLGDLPHLLGNPQVADALKVTLRTNLVANLLIVGIGTPASWMLATRSFPGRSIVITVLELPLILPPAVAGIALLAAAGRGGLFGDQLASVGIVLPFTEWAVVLAITFVAAPFYIRAAIAAFAAVDQSQIEVARTLGAGPLRTFFRVALPLAAGGLVAGWVIAFARGIGEFGATIVFAGSVRGQTQTLTLAVYDLLESSFDTALAVGVLLVAISLGVLVSYKLVVAWASRSTSTPPSAASLST